MRKTKTLIDVRTQKLDNHKEIVTLKIDRLKIVEGQRS